MKYIPYIKSINQEEKVILKVLKLIYGGKDMKFVKGLVIGGLITTGILMMWTDNDMSTKKMAKQGKRWAKKMGMM